jgi:TonB family protein
MKTLSLAVLVCLTQTAASFAGGPRPTDRPPGEPLWVTRDIQRPEKLSGARPFYTPEARAAGIGGAVVLQAILDEGGNVTDVEVLKGLPLGLSEAAVEAVETWKFKPAMQGGHAVRVYHIVTVNFVIDSTPPDGGDPGGESPGSRRRARPGDRRRRGRGPQHPRRRRRVGGRGL